jgi:glucose/mannose-6-phosphate isomerase
MGGSALPGGILSVYLADVFVRFPSVKPFAIQQNRSYALPPTCQTADCLHLIASYSGNTEETIACFEEALEKNLSMVVLSSGGKLEALAHTHGIPHIKLPVPTPTFQPRMGTGYFFAAIVQVLMNVGLLPDLREEIVQGSHELKGALEKLETQGQALAQRLQGKTPVIYAKEGFRDLAMTWKIKINENAKTPAFYNCIPEMNHNEMVGYTLPQAAFYALLLDDPLDDPRNRKRFQVMLPLLQEKGVEGEILDIGDEGVYNRVFKTLLLGDFTAYHLALLYGQEPEPVEMVEAFKKLL